MKIPILTIILLVMLILSRTIKRTQKTENKKETEFWDREKEANFSRKKSLDDLDYISIPENIFSLTGSYLDSLKDKTIVNLNSVSNTELKISYGAANLTVLSEYDQNFSDLIKLIQDYVNNEQPDKHVTKTLLEYAIEIGSDISQSFDMLSDIYIEDNEKAKLHYLIKKAEGIKSFRNKAIKKMLVTKLDTD